MVVRGRDINGRERITTAIAIATIGAIAAMTKTRTTVTGTIKTEAGRRAIVTTTTTAADGIEMTVAVLSIIVVTAETMAIVRPGIGIAAIRASGGTVTARVPRIAMAFRFARAMPGHGPIRNDAERERQRTRTGVRNAGPVLHLHPLTKEPPQRRTTGAQTRRGPRFRERLNW